MNNTYRIFDGHWLTVAKQIPDASVHVCVTSPPYYGLRSYGTEPQIWSDPSNWTQQVAIEEGTFHCDHDWIPIKQYKDSWRRGETASSYAQSHGVKRTPEQLKEGRWTHTEVCGTCNAWRGELGQEPSPTLFIEHLTQCFAEVWRILRPDGTLWVNIGDSHYNYRPGQHDDARAQGYNRLKSGNARDIPSFTAKRGYKIEGLKEKDLIGIPWMLAFALRDWGWYWRSECHWFKPNPLSESVTDRPTKNHEPILMFTKSERCFYDKWAITEPPTGNTHPRLARSKRYQTRKNNGNAKGFAAEGRNNNSFMNATVGDICPGGRNKRSFWIMNVQGYPEDHYAAFTEELPKTAILAGSSEIGCCRECGAPWSRMVLKPAKAINDKDELEERWRRAAAERGIDIDNATTGDSITLGWQRNCSCYAGRPVAATVLDPFSGRGTTGTVAVRYGRNFVGADLKPEYVKMIRKNLAGESPLWVSEGATK
jgi:DNA modification methylase